MNMLSLRIWYIHFMIMLYDWGFFCFARVGNLPLIVSGKIGAPDMAYAQHMGVYCGAWSTPAALIKVRYLLCVCSTW